MATSVRRLVKFGMQAHDDLIEKYSVEENLADAIVTNTQEALILALEESDQRFEKTIQESNQRFEEARQESNRRFEEARQESNRRFEEARRESNRRFAEIRADIKQEFGKVYERFDGIGDRLNGLENKVKNFKLELTIASFVTAGLTAGMLIGLDKLLEIL